MIFLGVLAAATTSAGLVMAARRRLSLRAAARWGMAVAMAVAGASHLLMPEPFVQHLPPWVPLREELVLLSGLLEIAMGAALVLLPRRLRRAAGAVLAAYLVAVLPANVYVAVSGVDVDGQPGGAYPWLRLPLQVLFVAWAVWCAREDPRQDGGGAGGG